MKRAFTTLAIADTPREGEEERREMMEQSNLNEVRGGPQDQIQKDLLPNMPAQLFCEHSIAHVVTEGPNRGACAICSKESS